MISAGKSDELSTFPRNDIEALAILYVQNQDLSGLSPSEIQTMYYDAYYELKKDRRQKQASGWLSKKNEESRQL